MSVFSDRDLEPQQHKIEAELDRADVFFASLLFDYDQVSCLMAFRLLSMAMTAQGFMRPCCLPCA